MVSEFNAENNEEAAAQAPSNQIMVDNFLNAQNAINIGSAGKMMINPNQVQPIGNSPAIESFKER